MSIVEVKIRMAGDLRKASEITKDIEERVEKAFPPDKTGIYSIKIAVDEKELEIPVVVATTNKKNKKEKKEKDERNKQ
jgi:hypothetical protein